MSVLSDTEATLCAIACHEANRKFCQSIGDMPQKPWFESTGWQQQSALAGVRFVFDNPDAPPSANHDSWSAEKVRDGWVYGEVKDPEAKTHPCLVPFEDLPPEQQFKDVLFRLVCHTFGIGLMARGL